MEYKSNPNEAEELLPCPFCGNSPIISRPRMQHISYEIYCNHCGCRLISRRCMHDCVKDWNTRVSPPPVKVPSLTVMSNIVMENVILTDRGWLLHDKSADNIAKSIRNHMINNGDEK